jgi:hypothetical protein
LGARSGTNEVVVSSFPSAAGAVAHFQGGMGGREQMHCIGGFVNDVLPEWDERLYKQFIQ